tara:strand:- start:1759 stop:2505 length:747 start_codon:yes stop_codon:yes gene_type:complete
MAFLSQYPQMNIIYTRSDEILRLTFIFTKESAQGRVIESDEDQIKRIRKVKCLKQVAKYIQKMVGVEVVPTVKKGMSPDNNLVLKLITYTWSEVIPALANTLLVNMNWFEENTNDGIWLRQINITKFIINSEGYQATIDADCIIEDHFIIKYIYSNEMQILDPDEIMLENHAVVRETESPYKKIQFLRERQLNNWENPFRTQNIRWAYRRHPSKTEEKYQILQINNQEMAYTELRDRYGGGDIYFDIY